MLLTALPCSVRLLLFSLGAGAVSVPASPSSLGTHKGFESLFEQKNKQKKKHSKTKNILKNKLFLNGGIRRGETLNSGAAGASQQCLHYKCIACYHHY